MPTKQEGKQHSDREKAGRLQLSAIIGQHVMTALGQPVDLHQVQVRHLWADRYRVNVLVGADAACAKVAHSYFLVTDSDGRIVESAPQIIRHYQLPPSPRALRSAEESIP
jgi:hypothetical protein